VIAGGVAKEKNVMNIKLGSAINPIFARKSVTGKPMVGIIMSLVRVRSRRVLLEIHCPFLNPPRSIICAILAPSIIIIQGGEALPIV
jgi:hypothetical protein